VGGPARPSTYNGELSFNTVVATGFPKKTAHLGGEK
jgi:hypothetical protein